MHGGVHGLLTGTQHECAAGADRDLARVRAQITRVDPESISSCKKCRVNLEAKTTTPCIHERRQMMMCPECRVARNRLVVSPARPEHDLSRIIGATWLDQNVDVIHGSGDKGPIECGSQCGTLQQDDTDAG